MAPQGATQPPPAALTETGTEAPLRGSAGAGESFLAGVRAACARQVRLRLGELAEARGLARETQVLAHTREAQLYGGYLRSLRGREREYVSALEVLLTLYGAANAAWAAGAAGQTARVLRATLAAAPGQLEEGRTPEEICAEALKACGGRKAGAREAAAGPRLLIATKDFPPASNGIANHCAALAEALVGAGCAVDVLTLGGGEAGGETRACRVHRVRRVEAEAELCAHRNLNPALADACELAAQAIVRHSVEAYDGVLVPLWEFQGFALVEHFPEPVGLLLQTPFARVLELRGKAPSEAERAYLALDAHCLRRAGRLYANSAGGLAEVARLYPEAAPLPEASVIAHGLPETGGRGGEARVARKDALEALVVGRLERRKGTAELLEHAPGLLEAVPGLRLRLVGADRGAPLPFRERLEAAQPGLAGRVELCGEVDDAALEAAYAGADVLVHVAASESFGLVYLEAMRAGLPVVTFRSAGTDAVFPEGEVQGALVLAGGDWAGLGAALAALAAEPARRERLGRAGRRRYEEAFTARAMGEAFAAAVPGLRAAGAARGSGAVYSVMEALSEGDAVSDIALDLHGRLRRAGREARLLRLFATPQRRGVSEAIEEAAMGRADAVLFHYWGFSWTARHVVRLPCRKALYYHNITPPEFFPAGSEGHEMCTRGCLQLPEILDSFDVLAGVSAYNLGQLREFCAEPKPEVVVRPVVEPEALRAEAVDEAYLRELRAGGEPVFLFVGRLAPNKRQDQVMRAFDAYRALTGRGRLLLVGNASHTDAYTRQLHALRDSLAGGPAMTLTGKVSPERLRACYRAADVFLCASEHEGCCVPLLEAMAFGVPLMALDRAAVGETLGGAGILLERWEPQSVALQAADILESPAARKLLLEEQRGNLERFSAGSAARALATLSEHLRA